MKRNSSIAWLYFLLAILGILAALIGLSQTKATDGCDYYEQHAPSPGHPNGWGECKYYTHTPKPTRVKPTKEPTLEPTSIVPSLEPTNPPPTEPVSTDDPATPTQVDPTTVPTTVVEPTQVYYAETVITCTRKCVYNLGGKPGTHAVTAWSPVGVGPFTWQINIDGVWYDVYDCYGDIVQTTVEYRVKFNSSTGRDELTAITRLTVDSSSPTDPSAYRVVAGAEFYDFDNFNY